MIPAISIIHGFHICEFAYSLEFIRNPMINTHTLEVLQGPSQRGEQSESPDRHVLSQG